MPELCGRRKESWWEKKPFDKCKSNPNYRFLHDQIADVFAKLLKSDLKFLNEDETRKSVWLLNGVPLLTLLMAIHFICESVARRLFSYNTCPGYEGIEESHYAYRVPRSAAERSPCPRMQRTGFARGLYELQHVELTSLQSSCFSTHENSQEAVDNDQFIQHIQITSIVKSQKP